MEKRNHRRGVRVGGAQIGAFAEIAGGIGEREVGRHGFSAMLHCDDVFAMEGDW